MNHDTETGIQETRAVFEATVLRWPEVSTRKMFGSPAYLANGKLFAFFVSDALVITKLSETERDELAGDYPIEPFQTGSRTIRSWARAPVADESDLDHLLPYITASYDAALEESYAENA